MKSRHQQHGVALVIGLILLVVITLLGVSATSTAIVEEKMASNMRDSEMALHAGETGLRDAETWLASLNDEPIAVDVCSVPPCVWRKNSMGPSSLSADPENWWQYVDEDWWDDNAEDLTSVALSGIASDPRSVVEENEFVKDTLLVGSGSVSNQGTLFYRVTTKGTGGSDQARVLLQSTWSGRF